MRQSFFQLVLGLVLVVVSPLPIAVCILHARQYSRALRDILERNNIANAAESAAEIHFEIGWFGAIVPWVLALFAGGVMCLSGLMLIFWNRKHIELRS